MTDNNLLRTAQAALDLLKQIQGEIDPIGEMPWPEIDDLERSILDNLKKEGK